MLTLFPCFKPKVCCDFLFSKVKFIRRNKIFCLCCLKIHRPDKTEDMKMFSNKQDIERLLDGWNKSSNQRIPAVVESIVSYDKQQPSNDPGFVFGYETALIFMEFCSCETPNRFVLFSSQFEKHFFKKNLNRKLFELRFFSTNEQECRARAFAESNVNNTFEPARKKIENKRTNRIFEVYFSISITTFLSIFR